MTRLGAAAAIFDANGRVLLVGENYGGAVLGRLDLIDPQFS